MTHNMILSDGLITKANLQFNLFETLGISASAAIAMPVTMKTVRPTGQSRFYNTKQPTDQISRDICTRFVHYLYSTQ